MILKFTKLNLISIIIFILSLNTSFAFNYCAKDNKNVSINYIIPKNYPNSEKNAHLKALSQIMSEISAGDFVQFSITTNNSTVNVVSQCFPGCPPKSMSEQIFGIGDKCNTTRMKRDKKNFDISLAKPFIKIKNDGNIIENGVTDIFLALESLSKFQKIKNFDKSYIINSMNPLNDTNNISDKELDELFVKIVSENKVPKDLPEAIFIGLTQNSKIISFWTDVFAINKKKFIYQ